MQAIPLILLVQRAQFYILNTETPHSTQSGPVQELPVLQNNINEALRLFPPLIMLMRQVKRTFSVTTRTGRTYTIPKVVPSFHWLLLCTLQCGT